MAHTDTTTSAAKFKVKRMLVSLIFSLSSTMTRKMFIILQLLLIFSVALLFMSTLHFDPVREALKEANNSTVKTIKDSLELTQTLNLQRQEYLQKQCNSLGYSTLGIKDLTTEQMEHMIIDKKHKILYCFVPKVACTNWKRIFMLLTGKWKEGTDLLKIPSSLPHSLHMFDTFNSLNETEKYEVLSNYTRFMFVRHPFERLLSAYRNKLEHDTVIISSFQKTVGRQIVRSIRVNASEHSLEYGDDVSFQEFVQYLLTPEFSLINGQYNDHWEPINKLCNPCVMKYHVLGKYETLLDDSALALYLTGFGNMTFPAHHTQSKTSSLLREYMDLIPLGSVRQLFEVYADDFKFFDYGLNDVLGFEFS